MIPFGQVSIAPLGPLQPLHLHAVGLDRIVTGRPTSVKAGPFSFQCFYCLRPLEKRVVAVLPGVVPAHTMVGVGIPRASGHD